MKRGMLFRVAIPRPLTWVLHSTGRVIDESKKEDVC